uniref:Dsp3 n=1 Tax=Leptosphaeria maculans TaxID=5022 RepID=D6N9S7_LEPMC|nr:dsp3 [Plenodomus lingam]
MAAKYASNAWKEVERQCFDDEDGMDYRLVQAATLLALWDFLARGSVSMAQALHMTKEPDNTLCFSAQEERRRTLWSIYLFDKMATCGRDRPSLFRDQTIDLQLPCSDTSFWMSTPEKIVTLEGFNSLEDSQIRNLAPSALTIVLASILSQTSNYAFKHNKSSNQKPPWDHTSEYQVICSQLTRFETLFDSYGDIQEQILIKQKLSMDVHPFLLRRRLEECSLTIPTRFFARAIESGSNHAQEISRTLTNAARAKYRVSATILGYFSLVAASINGLFQHSADETTRMRSAEALAGNLAHIEAKAKHWKTSARMRIVINRYTKVATLTHFSRESARYSPLIDTSFQTVPLTAADIELLYSLCDYGTISSSRTKDIALLNTNETTPTPLNLDPMLNNAASADTYSNFENLEDFSGLIEGIIPQFFDHTNARTVLDDFSSALGQFGGADCSASGQGWDFHS